MPLYGMNSTSGACLRTCAATFSKISVGVIASTSRISHFTNASWGSTVLLPGPAIAAMHAVDRQGRVEHQPVRDRPVSRLVEALQAEFGLHLGRIERETAGRLKLELGRGDDAVVEAFDGDFALGVLHRSKQMNERPDRVGRDAAEIA